MSTAIEFNHVSKQYRLGLVSTKTLSHDIRRFWITNILGKEDPYLKIGETNDRASKGNSEYVWALRDIDFKVEQGDVVGIIGKNGAGKSTLLKLLSRVTGPTTGTIRAKGRIGSLLEVGTGFHPELTGRENIFMNGAILGMSKAEIQAKLDEIIDFSGCERYIDTPVKRYSSGMTVRLGFAVAAFLEPEILVVDEVLAVGDAEFQKKAIGKMKDVSQGDGRTVLFVSHNMASIRSLCKTGVVLDKGSVAYMGNVFNAVDFYLSQNAFVQTATHVDIEESQHDKNRSLDAKIIMAEFVDDKSVFASDEDIRIRVKVQSRVNINECRVNIGIYNADETPVGSYSSDAFFKLKVGELKLLEYTLHRPNLALGSYSLAFSVGMGNAQTGETNLDVVHHVLTFDIDRMSKDENKFFVKWDKSWGTMRFEASMKEIA